MSSRSKTLQFYADQVGRPVLPPAQGSAHSELAAAKALLRRMGQELDTLAEHLGRVERALSTRAGDMP